MDAGHLRSYITIQSLSKAARNAVGEPTGSWADVCNAWACVLSINAREFWEAQAAHAELTHTVTIRYRSGITADMRVLWGTRKLDVAAPPVDVENRHEWLVLKCREVTT